MTNRGGYVQEEEGRCEKGSEDEVDVKDGSN